MSLSDDQNLFSKIGSILTRLGKLPPDVQDDALEQLNSRLEQFVSILAEYENGSGQTSVETAGCKMVFADSEKSVEKGEEIPASTGSSGESSGGEDSFADDKAGEISSCGMSEELRSHIVGIQSGEIHPHPLSTKFEEYIQSYIQNHDSQFLGHFLSESLWDGSQGWKTTDSFFAMASYIWHNAKDMFQPLDPDREIIEDKKKWNQDYFGKQRNYLRHNFALERLCHLIMIYGVLHGKQANAALTSPSPEAPSKPKIYGGKRTPFLGDPADNTLPRQPQGRSSRKMMWLGIILVIAFVVIAGRILYLYSNSKSEKAQQQTMRREVEQKTSVPGFEKHAVEKKDTGTVNSEKELTNDHKKPENGMDEAGKAAK